MRSGKGGGVDEGRWSQKGMEVDSREKRKLHEKEGK